MFNDSVTLGNLFDNKIENYSQQFCPFENLLSEISDQRRSISGLAESAVVDVNQYES
jgi:hypothetical protein